MNRKPLVALIFILLLKPAFGQTNNLANKYLDFFQEPVKKIAIDILAFNKHLFIKTNKNKAEAQKKHLLDYTARERARFEKKEDFVGQESLKKESLYFLESVQNYLTTQQVFDFPETESYNADSVFLVQKSFIFNLDLLYKASIRIHEEQQNFCLVNRIPDRPKEIGINSIFLEAIKVEEYCIEINKRVMSTRHIERLFLTSIGKDTGNRPDEIRQTIILAAEEGTLKLKGLPTHKNDRSLKNSALNSLRLYRAEASGALVQLLNFRKHEQDFYKHHFKAKEKGELTPKEKDRYRIAIADYNANIKKANEVVKELEEKRLVHEKDYDMAYRAYIEEMLTIEY